MKSVQRWGLLAVMIAAQQTYAFSQTIPPSEQPGKDLQRFQQPVAPRATTSGVTIHLPGTVAPAGAAQTMVLLDGVVIEGSTIYQNSDLRPLYASAIGHRVSIAALYEIAQKITAKYGADGYVLSRATVPPQAINPKGAIIHLRVVEGYVDKVVWPANLSRYRDFFTDYAAKITAQRPANINTIERYMLLARELPGLTFSTKLEASKDSVGASTLMVFDKEKPIDASVQVDNRGTAARGPIEFQASVTENNLLGWDEALTLSYSGALPLQTLHVVSGNYHQVISSEGLQFLLDANHSWGTPGTAPLEALQYQSASTTIDAGLMYPIVRQRELELSLTGLVFGSNNDADTLGAPFNRDRLRGFRLKLDGDWAGAARGSNQINVIVSQGIDGLGSSHTGDPLASRLAGHVDFTKIEATLSRKQPLFGNLSAFAAVYGQYAFAPLLSPEQCGFGGRTFGRGFDPSELTGDQCVMALGELRYDLNVATPQISKAQLYAFADFGRLHTLEAALGTPVDSEGASVGGGVRLTLFGDLSTDLQLAKTIDGPNHDWRVSIVGSINY